MARDYHSRRMPTEEPPRRAARDAWIAAALYLVLTLALTYPLSTSPASTIIWRNADTDLFMWTLAWNTHAIIHQPLAHLRRQHLLPVRAHAGVLGEPARQRALRRADAVGSPAIPVLALNVVALSRSSCAGLAAICWPARRVVVGRRVPVRRRLRLCAVALLPHHAAAPDDRAVDPVHAGVAARLLRRRPRGATSGSPSAFFSLQALTSGHGAVFLVVAAAGLAVYRFAARRAARAAPASARRRHHRRAAAAPDRAHRDSVSRRAGRDGIAPRAGRVAGRGELPRVADARPDVLPVVLSRRPRHGARRAHSSFQAF